MPAWANGWNYKWNVNSNCDFTCVDSSDDGVIRNLPAWANDWNWKWNRNTCRHECISDADVPASEKENWPADNIWDQGLCIHRCKTADEAQLTRPVWPD